MMQVLAEQIARHLTRCLSDVPASLLCGLAFSALTQVARKHSSEERIREARNGSHVVPWADDTNSKRPIQGGDVPERLKEKTQIADRIRVAENRRILQKAHRGGSRSINITGDDHLLFGESIPDCRKGDDVHTANCSFCNSHIEIISSHLVKYVELYFTQQKKFTKYYNGVPVVQIGKEQRVPIIKTGRACIACVGSPSFEDITTADGETVKKLTYNGEHGSKIVEILPEADFRQRTDDDPQWADRIVVEKEINERGELEEQFVPTGKMGFETGVTFASSLARNPDWMGKNSNRRPTAKLKTEEEKDRKAKRFNMLLAQARAKVKMLRKSGDIAKAEYIQGEINKLLANRTLRVHTEVRDIMKRSS